MDLDNFFQPIPHLSPLRFLRDQPNKMILFDKQSENRYLIAGFRMLFISLEVNSELLLDALQFINNFHKCNNAGSGNGKKRAHSDSTESIKDQLLQISSPDDLLDKSMKDYLLRLYACMESYIGCRQEALVVFGYWIDIDRKMAVEIFSRITHEWPWTNRNKYYFLSVILEHYDMNFLLSQQDVNRKISLFTFAKGISVSLQYRNLLSAGQTLVTTLIKTNHVEILSIIADVLKEGSDFEVRNCINHWMKCIPGPSVEDIFHILQLDNPDILRASEFSYLVSKKMQRLILLRSCFKKNFEQLTNIREIDEFIKSKNVDGLEIVEKISMIEVVVCRCVKTTGELDEYLNELEVFLKENMCQQYSALRNDILKVIPNMLYLFASYLKTISFVPRIKSFFIYFKESIFEYGIQQTTFYQPLVFSLRILEICLKTLYGTKEDRVIKKFNQAVNEKLILFLQKENIWDLRSQNNFSFLLTLINSDFDDIRELSVSLLLRFFIDKINTVDVPQNCFIIEDIMSCSYIHYFARLIIHGKEDFGKQRFCNELELYLATNCTRFHQDPLNMARNGNHFFGALNCLNEYYVSQCTEFTINGNQIKEHVKLATNISEHMLDLMQYGRIDINDDGHMFSSPNFEEMDESLTRLVTSSTVYQVENREVDKKFLLKSIWMSLKACCEISSNIVQRVLNKCISDISERDTVHLVKACCQISVNTLTKCRHKGAIEGAGITLGKIVKCITTYYTTTNKSDDSINFLELPKLLQHLLDCIDLLFDIIGANTTRRGAGLSIMVHHIVKNDKNKHRLIFIYVMKKCLLHQANHSKHIFKPNRDNMQSTILHILCVLVQDAELKSPLTPYLYAIFELASYGIESEEWPIRNAALQLFGALVPKIVGQSQYYENSIDWEPAYAVYSDILIKMNRIHVRIENVLKNSCSRPNVLLVIILELLSRIESIDFFEEETYLKQKFYQFLSNPCEKIRKLAAKCLTRFMKFNEIPQNISPHIKQIFSLVNENARHGHIMVVNYMLKKYESDCRYTSCELPKEVVFKNVVEEFTNQYKIIGKRNFSYYTKMYLFDLLQYVGMQMTESIFLDIIFNNNSATIENVQRLLLENYKEVNVCTTNFGFSMWRTRMLKLYLGIEENE